MGVVTSRLDEQKINNHSNHSNSSDCSSVLSCFIYTKQFVQFSKIYPYKLIDDVKLHFSYHNFIDMHHDGLFAFHVYVHNLC